MQQVLLILQAIKFQHTLFALPFAVASAFVAARGSPPGQKFLWILVAMVAARTAAMAFNRIADFRFDIANPRTAGGPVPTRAVSLRTMWLLYVVSACIFICAAFMLNQLCFFLSPLALLILTLYSLTKRFTDLSHFFLGLCLGMAPIGAWLGVTETFASAPLILGLAVMLWAAGFDIIYSCLDVEFDRKAGLHSLPASVGVEKALKISLLLHMIFIAVLGIFMLCEMRSLASRLGIVPVALLIVYEHYIVRPNDLSRVNQAFFHVNAIVSILVMAFVILDVLLEP